MEGVVKQMCERLIEILKEGVKPNIETDYDDHPTEKGGAE